MMEVAWQHGLVQQSQIKRHNRAFRLARAAWRLARRDSALAPLALLLAGSVALAIVALVVAVSHLSHGFHALSLYFLLLIGAGFGVTFLIGVFSAAAAHAANAGFDGGPMTIREAIAEAWESWRQLLVWSSIATAVLAAAELIIWTGRTGMVVGNFGLAVWSFFVAFVVPIIALEAASASEAVRESAALAKRRWGEELVGGFTIAFLWAVAAFLCLMVYVPGLHAFQDHHGGGSVVAMAVGGLTGLLTVLYGIATAQAFIVALMRLDSGESTLEELASPPPSVHSRPIAFRIVGLALCTTAVVGLVALIASVGIAERSEQYYTSLPTTSAGRLGAGAPVVYEEQQVGQVLATLSEGSVTRVSFEVKESIASQARGEPIGIDTFDGRPCLRIGAAPSLGSDASLNLKHPGPTAGLRKRHSGPPPIGLWAATGTVLSAVNLADERAGSVLKRPWAFRTICKSSSCRTIFLRETLYGPSRTVLVAHDGYYTAAFPPVAVPCSGTGRFLGRLYDSYTLRWLANRKQILAIQHQRGSGGCGLPSRQTTRWTATRIHPTLTAAAAPGA
jgi:hypothetical protein